MGPHGGDDNLTDALQRVARLRDSLAELADGSQILLSKQDKLLERVAGIAEDLEAEAQLTHPSKASEIKRDVATRIRAVLAGE